MVFLRFDRFRARLFNCTNLLSADKSFLVAIRALMGSALADLLNPKIFRTSIRKRPICPCRESQLTSARDDRFAIVENDVRLSPGRNIQPVPLRWTLYCRCGNTARRPVLSRRECSPPPRPPLSPVISWTYP